MKMRKPPKIRTAVRTDAKRIHELIEQHMQEGRLLPRQLSELDVHVNRFVVAVDGRGAIVGCGELAPLSHSVAEVRSLVVTGKRRGSGVGRRIVNELRERARRDGYDDLCVFAHQPAYFAHMGFSIVPHTWLPEKSRRTATPARCSASADSTRWWRIWMPCRTALPQGSLSMSETAAVYGVKTQSIDGGVTAPAGFKAAGVLAGIKASPQLDLALVVSDELASAAGVFTTNRAQAAPVLLSKMNLERSEGRARAIVCNSGCANACTGDAGFNVSKSTAEIAARLFGCRPEEVLVASTGVIGVDLDLGKVSKGINKAAGVLAKSTITKRRAPS